MAYTAYLMQAVDEWPSVAEFGVAVIILRTEFILLSSWYSQCKSYPVHLMNVD